MNENKQSVSDKKSARLYVGLIVILVLCWGLWQAKGENNGTFEGVVTMEYQAYKFYPYQTGCNPTGRWYWFDARDKFFEVAAQPRVSDLSKLNQLFNAKWKVRLRGNLSSLGHFGIEKFYWRELEPVSVMQATTLECSEQNSRPPN